MMAEDENLLQPTKLQTTLLEVIEEIFFWNFQKDLKVFVLCKLLDVCNKQTPNFCLDKMTCFLFSSQNLNEHFEFE